MTLQSIVANSIICLENDAKPQVAIPQWPVVSDNLYFLQSLQVSAQP